MLKHATETPIRSCATQNPTGGFPQCVARSGLEYQRQKPISHSQHQGAGPLGCAYEICAYLPLTSPGPMGFSYGARHLETIGLNDSTRGAQHKSSNALSQSDNKMARSDAMIWANPRPQCLSRTEPPARAATDFEAEHKPARWRDARAASRVPAPGTCPLEMHDVEHSLCELDKLPRVRNGEGKPRARYWPARHPNRSE